MPVTFFNNDKTGEQAKGATLDAGVMDIFAVRVDDPTNLISLKGHRFDEAPTYNIAEGKISPEYREVNGRNRIIERQLSGDYIKGVTYNLQMPNKLVSVTDFIFQNQERCDYDLFMKPRNCPASCDDFFWQNEDMKLSPKQISTTVAGYDENAIPMTVMRTLKCSGSINTYHGLQVSFLNELVNALYAVLVLDEDCEDCGCPHQNIIRGGAGVTLANSTLEYSTDGGKVFTTIDTTALTVDKIVTDIKYINGYLVVSYSDVAAAVGTAGGVAYSLGVGPALVLSTMDVASLGIQTMEVVGNKVYAFGTGGETYLSCDNGISFTKNVDSPITVTIIDSSYDKKSDLIFLAGSAAEAWEFNELAFTQIDGDFTPTGAVDLESVEVVRHGGGIAFGGADGNYYETWNYGGLGVGDWAKIAHGAGGVGAIASDGYGFRTIVGHGDDVIRRSISTNQDWEVFSEAPVGNFTAIEAVTPISDEGVNYFIGVTDTGETVQIVKCYTCLESC